MNAQEYILSQLEDLKATTQIDYLPKDNQEMVDAIFKSLMSKKFRKYSVPEKNQQIIRVAIEKDVQTGAPVQIAWPFGGYKLWRFDESPEPDWAELFNIMYLAKWLKQVCAVYSHGAVLTYWFDEVVISQMNNIPQSDLDTYKERFQDLLFFVKPYLPDNLQFEIFLERDQYESQEVFQEGLKIEMDKLQKLRAENPKPLSEEAKRSIEMNVRLTPEQEQDPQWMEKIDLMHYAYYNLQEQQSGKRPAYATANITAFSTFFEPNVIPVGSTKTSIVRFWVGVGALEPRGEAFIETILSPKQLEKAKFTWEPVNIRGLTWKNFQRVRVLKSDTSN